MAIQFPGGFIINSSEPVDSRIAVTSRLDQNAFRAYEGLIVYDITEKKVYVLNDVTDPSLESSWTEVGSGTSSGIPQGLFAEGRLLQNTQIEGLQLVDPSLGGTLDTTPQTITSLLYSIFSNTLTTSSSPTGDRIWLTDSITNAFAAKYGEDVFIPSSTLQLEIIRDLTVETPLLWERTADFETTGNVNYIGSPILVYNHTLASTGYLQKFDDGNGDITWRVVQDLTGNTVRVEASADNEILATKGYVDSFPPGSQILARRTGTVDSPINLITEYGLVDDSDPTNFVAYSFRRYLVDGTYFLRRTQISNDAIPLLDYGYVLQTQAEIATLQALSQAEQLTYLQGLTYGGPSVVTT